jgi:hypothetical protein
MRSCSASRTSSCVIPESRASGLSGTHRLRIGGRAMAAPTRHCLRFRGVWVPVFAFRETGMTWIKDQAAAAVSSTTISVFTELAMKQMWWALACISLRSAPVGWRPA